jgi:hypothetical protein
MNSQNDSNCFLSTSRDRDDPDRQHGVSASFTLYGRFAYLVAMNTLETP